MAKLVSLRAGLVDYQAAWAWQREVHTQRVAGVTPDTVLLLEHPSVYTAGRRTQPWERPSDGTQVVEVDRGGKITWHGPGQLVGYPIRRLPAPVDVVAHVRSLEEALLAVCDGLGVAAMRVAGRSGVWVCGTGPDRKLAAIGVRVERGVTLHGFALNVDADLSAFDAIVPCGIADAGVTSLAQELGGTIRVADLLDSVEAALAAVWDAELVIDPAACPDVTVGV